MTRKGKICLPVTTCTTTPWCNPKPDIIKVLYIYIIPEDDASKFWIKINQPPQDTFKYLVLIETKLIELQEISPSFATTSTWFSLSTTVKQMSPIQRTAASIANTLYWSSLLMWTISKASWKGLMLKLVNTVKNNKKWQRHGILNLLEITCTTWNFSASSTPVIEKQLLCFRYLYSCALFKFSFSVLLHESYMNWDESDPCQKVPSFLFLFFLKR